MRERDFHSFEKGFKYQLCLRNAVESSSIPPDTIDEIRRKISEQRK